MDLLIIEDDPGFASLLKRTLEGLMDNVAIVSDWGEAFRVVKTDGRDVVWVDLRMPSSDEHETIERIARLRQDHSDIVIIVGSGFITPEIRAALDRAGIDGCYYKTADYTAEQIGSLIVLGMMRASKRSPHFNDAMLKKALEWLHKRFPNTVLA